MRSHVSALTRSSCAAPRRHKSPGLLHYISGEGLVILKPGLHTIKVDRDVVGVGGAPDKLEESYLHTFTSL